MNLLTPVGLPPSPIRLTPHSHTFFIGSCFADHIGALMAESLPSSQVCVNPRGPLYNPVSIRQTIASLLPSRITSPFSEEVFFKTADGQWRHWDFSTKFSASTRGELHTMLSEEWKQSSEAFSKLDTLFVTFSTDHTYRLVEGNCAGHCVANCHKQPARIFVENVETLHSLHTLWSDLLTMLHKELPQLQIVFTLSPYRYAKYGMHENALSKARLLLLIDALCTDFDFAHYFPAYEIVLDELRDYRFFAEDMLHPSHQAVSYIWERFRQWAFTPQLIAYAQERAALLRDINHRPINPLSEAHQAFLRKLEEKKKAFRKKWGLGDDAYLSGRQRLPAS